jgi:UDP-N-acetylmuramoyl-L-alanyl-D-glutamate--2,6-diaminopimelate ligase
MLAATVYGHPSDRVVVLGVTGTSGKTTTSHLIEAGLRAAGRTAGMIGTVGVRIAGTDIPSALTTPEAPALQALLAVMAEAGVDTAVMEVSSHALELGRVDGIRFAVGGFTNLSRDHLDVHPTMEAYFDAKAMLFTEEHARRAVIFVDDPWGERLMECTSIPVTPVRRSDATDVTCTVEGSTFRWRDRSVQLPIPGRVNVDNAIVALTAAAALDVDLDLAIAGLAEMMPVPGRLERVGSTSTNQPTVLVDYAHTPAGLETVLSDLRRLMGFRGHLIVVFGCGGDRDRQKRSVMGEVASRLADQVVVTSDNPRSEEPAAIAAQIVDGVPASLRSKISLHLDRSQAIHAAIAQALPGDVVLIAGKGHEAVQDLGGSVTSFSDHSVAMAALAAREGDQ